MIEIKCNKLNQDLVSIIVITYNSSKYILETLDSIKSQTYKNIELVVSDDCSSDTTVEICKSWLNDNSDCFFRTELIASPQNTGVAHNCNQGSKASHGKWLKFIAGDDKLFPEAITEFVHFVIVNNCKICCCKMKLFGEDEYLISINDKYFDKSYKEINKDLEHQRKLILNEQFIPAPGLFFSRELFDSVGGFDEEYQFCEDWPFLFKVLKSGNKGHLINKYLVYYRIYNDSLTSSLRCFNDVKKFFYNERLHLLLKGGHLLLIWHLYLYYLYKTLWWKVNRYSFLSILVKGFLVFSPLSYIHIFKKYIYDA